MSTKSTIAGTAESCEFQVIRTRHAFDALEPEWNALFDRAAKGSQVFQNFNWLWHWCNHYLKDGGATELSIVIGRRNGRLALVWPVMIQRSHGLSRLVWMGQPVSQYGDILIDNTLASADDLKRSWQYLSNASGADVVHLRKVRDDSSVVSLLKTIATTPVVHSRAPYLDLSGTTSFDHYQTRYSSKARKNRRRLRRRVEQQGDVQFNTSTNSNVNSNRASLAVHLKRKWLNKRGLLSPAMHDDRIKDFFGDVANAGSHPTGCRISSLSVDGDDIAIEIGFAAKGHLAVHVIVYRLEYEKCGAGALLMEDSIKAAIEQGIATYDLMAPGDSYKMDWADGTIGVGDWLHGLTLAGRAYQRLRLSNLPMKAKAVLKAMPQPLRRLVATTSCLA